MTRAAFLLMPQWQGSSSSRAMQLTDGAAALREDLPTAATIEVAVPLEAGDAMGTPVARLSSVLRARDAAAAVLRDVEDLPIILGGDCATSLAGIDAALRDPAPLAVLWFAAHPCLEDPSTSPSGAAGRMALRHLLGDGFADLAATVPVDAALLTLVGARESDPEEQQLIEDRKIATIDANGGDAETLGDALRHRLAHLASGHPGLRLYVHVDLDVLDPAEFASVHEPVPFGLTTAELTTGIRAAVAEVPLAGATLSGFAPGSDADAREDEPTVLRVLAALTSRAGNQ